MRLLTTDLPRHAAERQKPSLAAAAAIWRNPYPTVLLIDDDAAVRESLCRVLAGQQLHVVPAASGEEAVRLIAQQEPDLMITDLRMASVNGWDLLVLERRLRPDLPIFVITALPAGETCGADQFATEFFQKPLDLDMLLAAIRRHLGASGRNNPGVESNSSMKPSSASAGMSRPLPSFFSRPFPLK